MAKVDLKNIDKSFGENQILHGINLDIHDGEFLVLVGPSGCGKSTLLRLVAGLEETTSGDIFIGEKQVTDVEPKNRDIAMVFQNYALYPHMNVFDNMGFGLKLKKSLKQPRFWESQSIWNGDQKSCPVVSVSGWLWVGRSSVTRQSFYLMNLYPIWMQNYGSRCAQRSKSCMSNSRPP